VLGARHFGYPVFWPGDGRSGWYGVEVFFDQRQGFFRFDVAGQTEHGVVGAVIGAEPLFDIVDRGSFQVFHTADDGP